MPNIVSGPLWTHERVVGEHQLADEPVLERDPRDVDPLLVGQEAVRDHVDADVRAARQRTEQALFASPRRRRRG